jgi:hypothetical protein
MNYQRIHDAIIDRARTRTLQGYREKHHVIPRCMGGSDAPSNLIELTAREHFIVHKLLVQIYPDVYKLVYAYWMMSRNVSNSKYEREYKVSNRDYERARKLFSEVSSVKQKGRRLSDKHKQKLSLAAKTRKTRTPIKHSKETKQKLRSLWLGTTRSIEDRKKISEGQLGKKKGPYVIKNKPEYIQCPHCNKIGSPRGLKRWHFDNCETLNSTNNSL